MTSRRDADPDRPATTRPTRFSPDGSRLVGTGTRRDGTGPHDARCSTPPPGKPTVDFEVAGARTQVVGIDTRMAWEDDDTLVVRVTDRR